MIFKEEFTIGVRDVQNGNLATNKAILGYMEEIASTHSAKVGFGLLDIHTKKKAWILMDWKLKVISRPKYGEKIIINTWARPIENKLSTYRDFEMYDTKNNLLALATSKWVLFDLEKNRITKIEEELLSVYNPENKYVFENPMLEKIKEPDEYINSINYEVRRTDIDVNNHMHNLNYLDLAYEALPKDVYDKGNLNNVRIMYKHQICLGDSVECYYTFYENNHVVCIKNSKSGNIHAILIFEE